MSARIEVGAKVRVAEEDCCISFEGEGVVEAILYGDEEEGWGDGEPEAWDAEDILSVTIGGITMKGESHPLRVEQVDQ